jgi:hypothetical protein
MKQIRFWHIEMGGPGVPGAAPTPRIGVRGFVAPSVGPGGGGGVHRQGVMRGGGIGGTPGTSKGERGRVYLYSMIL